MQYSAGSIARGKKVPRLLFIFKAFNVSVCVDDMSASKREERTVGRPIDAVSLVRDFGRKSFTFSSRQKDSSAVTIFHISAVRQPIGISDRSIDGS